MQPAKSNRAHGDVRGATLDRASVLFGGPFGRIFRAVPPADFGLNDNASRSNLAALADRMIASREEPRDGPDDEESGLPAAYTYFGQFIDHDLTFDPASSLQRQNDPDALVDYRTPRFDLDNLYGRGPADQPYLYEPDGKTFLLGEKLRGAPHAARDLPRNKLGRALIGDPRNDENVIVAQLQGLFLRFHNRLAKEHSHWNFARVQREVRFHYQWIVVNDFLPKIVAGEVLNDVLPLANDGNRLPNHGKLRFFHYKNEAFMPLEFSAAAYRFGHSMVRPGYRINDHQGPLPIFAPGEGPDLRGFKPPHSDWAIDWKRFINLEPLPFGSSDKRNADNTRRMQLAYRIDTSIVGQLGGLPPETAGKSNPPSLAQLNLERGWRMRLPSGQDLARAMSLVPLPDEEIVIGKFTDHPHSLPHVSQINPIFTDNCPLWTYVLAETIREDVNVETTGGLRSIQTRKLGHVGGRIVVETFLGLLRADSSSYLNLHPLWEPSLKVNKVFGLRELIAYALTSDI